MRSLQSLLLLALMQAASFVAAAPKHNQAGTTGYWYADIKHNGISPTITNGQNWTVFRNVRDYGAKGDGTTDDTAAIQRAIDTGNSAGTRATGSQFGMTGQPAVVYFPAGTYSVSSTVSNRVGTILMGDPTSRPVIRAAASFTGTYLVVGHDTRYTGLVAFFHGLKNLVLDTTAIPTKTVTLLEWGVSQANQLSNVVFNMPVGAAGHTGIATPGECTQLLYNDLEIVGGGTGISLSVTQVHLKSILFKNVTTGVKITSAVHVTAQALQFVGCTMGIDTTSSGNGLLNLIDTTASDTAALVNAPTTSTAQSSMVIENVIVDASVRATVKIGTTTALTGSVPAGRAWIRGHVYENNNNPSSTHPTSLTGTTIPVSRPAALIDPSTGFYRTATQPTYADYPLSQVVNVKTADPAHPVRGDGTTDDAANIQAVLDASVGKVVYFPYGIYLLGDTVTVPVGSRLVGEAFTQLSATGSKFADARNPRAMIRVGRPGDVGVAQLSDFVFTVADVLPGAVLVEVNMAGETPGDVGFWFCNFRVGGAKGSKLWNNSAACGSSPAKCNAARLAAHLTASSSSYWEHTWAWSADLDLDGGSVTPLTSPGGGFLIEAAAQAQGGKNGGGTWILGMGAEHFDLYQVNINAARNVFVGLMEAETSHWQGNGTTYYPPAPWTAQSQALLPSDPDFSWCAATDAQCRMGLYQIVRNSTGVNLYSQGWWTFVMGPARTFCSTDCQDNGALYSGNSQFYAYGIDTINVKNLISEEAGVGLVTHADNQGAVHDVFQTALVAAYLRQSGVSRAGGGSKDVKPHRCK